MARVCLINRSNHRDSKPGSVGSLVPGIYLAVDRACRTCRLLGDLVASVGRPIQKLDLQDSATRQLLDRVRPGWRRAPYLIVVGRTTRAWTSLVGLVCLFWALRPVAAWKVYHGSRRMGVPLLPPLKLVRAARDRVAGKRQQMQMSLRLSDSSLGPNTRTADRGPGE
jgi:hypothetical protein